MVEKEEGHSPLIVRDRTFWYDCVHDPDTLLDHYHYHVSDIVSLLEWFAPDALSFVAFLRECPRCSYHNGQDHPLFTPVVDDTTSSCCVEDFYKEEWICLSVWMEYISKEEKRKEGDSLSSFLSLLHYFLPSPPQSLYKRWTQEAIMGFVDPPHHKVIKKTRYYLTVFHFVSIRSLEEKREKKEFVSSFSPPLVSFASFVSRHLPPPSLLSSSNPGKK